MAEARKLMHDENRVVLVGRAGKEGRAGADRDGAARRDQPRPRRLAVEAYTDALAGRDLVEKPPAPGKVTARRTMPEVGATVLTLSNGVEVWLKPTDFKNDQVLFSAYALGRRRRWRPKRIIQEASLATALVGVGGMGGLSPVDLEQAAGRQDRAGVADDRRLHARHHRAGVAARSRDGAEAELPGLHGAEPDARGVRAAEAPADAARSRTRRRTRGFVFNEKRRAGQHVEPLQRQGARRRPTSRRSISKRCSASTRERFANAADFTYFFVGAFTVDEITPLLERWVATLPSTGKKTSNFRDMGVRFPATAVTEEVRKGTRAARARR